MIAVGALVTASVVLDLQTLDWIVSSEASAVEYVSTLLWIVAALTTPFLIGRLSMNTVAASILCLGAAAREADWHNSFTGYSVLKPAFFLRGEYSVAAKLVSGVVIATVVASAVVVGCAGLHRARRAGGLRAPWVQVGIFALCLAAVSKSLDRAHDLLGVIGIRIAAAAQVSMVSVEEGLELFLPALLMVTALLYARDRPLSDV
ncbi:MAG: hypothetical protein SGJ09_02655 [Phycisphaerae bacterium]|nr:hypothetical protein [Phycisphaerae bacterium]